MTIQVTTVETFPAQRFRDKSGALKLMAAVFGAVPGNNQQVIAGISGKIIRIFGWHVQADNTTAGTLALKSGSGGSALYPALTFPANTSPPDRIPIFDGGYFEADVGVGLFADVATANLRSVFFYLAYTA